MSMSTFEDRTWVLLRLAHHTDEEGRAGRTILYL